MKVPAAVESALHLVVLLASIPDEAALPAADLAAFHDLSESSTAKLLQQLAAEGIAASREGRAGGYRLARPPEAITVADVVAAAGGDVPGFRCREIRQQGPCAGPAELYSARCAIAVLMHEAESAWWDALRTVDIATLTERIGVQVAAPISRNATRWLSERVRG